MIKQNINKYFDIILIVIIECLFSLVLPKLIKPNILIFNICALNSQLSVNWLWEIILSLFIHGSKLHLYFNLLCFLPAAVGINNYLINQHKVNNHLLLYLFLGSGIIGNIFYLVSMNIINNKKGIIIGCSGAVCGVLTFALIIYTKPVIKRLKAHNFRFKLIFKLLLLIFILYLYINSSLISNGSVSLSAHLGGISFGILFAIINIKRQKNV